MKEDETKTTIYILEGLGCAHCAAKMEELIRNLPGVEEAVLTFATKQLMVTAEHPETLKERIQNACDSVEEGVTVCLKEEGGRDKGSKSRFIRESQKDLVPVAAGTILFLMGILMTGWNPGTELSFFIFIAAYLVLGIRIVAAALKNLVKGHVFDENFLMSVATIGAFAIGDYKEAVGVMLFYRVGELFEEMAVNKSRTQIMEAVDLRPEVVRQIRGEKIVEIPAADAKPGDRIQIRPGDRIPLDGRIVEGNGRIDTSPITGEPVPVMVAEGSKVFSKNLMKQHGIPTAGYEVFSDADAAFAYIERQNQYPVVVKADGLALGKGVIIAQNREEAKAALDTIMRDKKFGASGNQVVIEEFISGPEVSVLTFCDGKTVVPMVSSMDHKRVFDGNKGPNTGGMGTISPNPHYTKELAKTCQETIFEPTVKAIAGEGCPFKGCLYFGLMLTKDGPRVIEFNARFGDPETQVVLPRLRSDLMKIMLACREGTLNALDIQWDDGAAACVVMASPGYPDAYPKGLPITGLDQNGQVEGAIVYHAGTAMKDGALVTNGGRVLGITATGGALQEALRAAYDAVERIHFEGAHYRRDIGTW